MSKSSKFTPKTYEDVLLGYDSNSHAYRDFNVTTDCIKITCDAVFDETNGSEKEQVDLGLVDNEEAPCNTLQRMTISDVRPQYPNNQPCLARVGDRISKRQRPHYSSRGREAGRAPHGSVKAHMAQSANVNCCCWSNQQAHSFFFLLISKHKTKTGYKNRKFLQ
jgi:hypothetical protein